MSQQTTKAERGGVRGNAAGDVTLTVDTFIAEVPIGPARSILVYLREHGGRRYVRWRVFHKHGKVGNWYPDKRRAFVLPVGVANALACAIASAAAGEATTPKPVWLAAVDAWRNRRCRCMAELNAPPKVLEAERRKCLRGWGIGSRC